MSLGKRELGHNVPRRALPRGLVLSRKQGESIHVGSAIITPIECVDGKVRLHISAPAETRILRDELLATQDALPARPDQPSAA